MAGCWADARVRASLGTRPPIRCRPQCPSAPVVGCLAWGVPLSGALLLRPYRHCSLKRAILEGTRPPLTRAELLRSPSRLSSQNAPSVSFGDVGVAHQSGPIEEA